MNDRNINEDDKVEKSNPIEEVADVAKDVVKEAAKKKAKLLMIKLGLAILSAIAPFLIVILIVIAIIAAAYFITSLVMGMLDTIYAGTDKLYNFFEYGSFRDSEGVFIERLKKEYEQYNRMPNKEGNLDIALIMSTINHGRIFETDDFGKNNNEDSPITDASEYYQVVSSKDTKSFFKVMNDELGLPYTLYPPDKKLLGHLIDIKITGVCIPKPTGLVTLANLGGEVADSAYEIAEVFGTMFRSTAFDPNSSIGFFNALKTLFGIKPFLIANQIWSYSEVDGADDAFSGMEAYMKAELGGYISGWENHNPISTLMRIAKNSEKPNCGENEVAIPKITYFQNYELYREYLIKYLDFSFVHRMYIDCSKCEYQNESDSSKRIIAERIVDEIFSSKDSYNSIVASETGIGAPIYIPGTSSFIFDHSFGENVLEAPPKGLMTSPFGVERYLTDDDGSVISQGPHGGVDFAIVNKTPLFALADGEVVVSECRDSYGNYVKIKHDFNGTIIYSLYAHLSALGVSVGEMVGGGQPIGLSGGVKGAVCSGATTGPHLHFEIQNAQGTRQNPIEYLRAAINGTGMFESSQTYLAMSDYDLPYCDSENSTKYKGSLPISLAILGRKLGLSTEPASLVARMCAVSPVEKHDFLDSAELKNEFKMVATKVLNPTIQLIDESLAAKKPLLISIKGGPFNLMSDSSHIVILQKNDKYLVLSTFNKAKNGLYSKVDIEKMIIPYINEGVWALEGVE